MFINFLLNYLGSIPMDDVSVSHNVLDDVSLTKKKKKHIPHTLNDFTLFSAASNFLQTKEKLVNSRVYRLWLIKNRHWQSIYYGWTLISTNIWVTCTENIPCNAHDAIIIVIIEPRVQNNFNNKLSRSFRKKFCHPSEKVWTSFRYFSISKYISMRHTTDHHRTNKNIFFFFEAFVDQEIERNYHFLS